MINFLKFDDLKILDRLGIRKLGLDEIAFL